MPRGPTSVVVVDVGRSAAFVCDQITRARGCHCSSVSLPTATCVRAQTMRSRMKRVQAAHGPSVMLVTACTTCASALESAAFRIPNAVLPVCALLGAYHTPVLLSTSVTARIRIHERLTGVRMRYVALDHWVDAIERDAALPANFRSDLERRRALLCSADCVVLACSHFCMHADRLRSELARLGFQGQLVDSVDVFVHSVRLPRTVF